VIIAIACAIAIAAIVYVLGVRPKDLPEPEPVSPFLHLDERKAAIYENLRDLQFEYRLGKLSDQDYQLTKQDLQKELATVMAEVDRVKQQLHGTAPASKPAAVPAPAIPAAKSAAAAAPKPAADPFVCPHCQARFPQDLKFCGECGKPMKVAQT